jgi:hypothetical protein
MQMQVICFGYMRVSDNFAEHNIQTKNNNITI